jgi:predicted solute-binding protein
MTRSVRLLIDETFVTTVYTLPIVSGWVAPPNGIGVERVAGLTARDVTPLDAALIPASELAALHASHRVVVDIAVISAGTGAIAMHTPVRPDEIEKTPVRLLGTSGIAELLARGTLRPFYGITPTAWLRDDRAPEAAQAQVVIVEGAEALREPEGGFSEDLSRAWFILTGQPVVTHLLLAPRQLADRELSEAIGLLDAARSGALARRSEWRLRLADNEGVARDRAAALWSAQRLRLEDADRQALLELLARGAPGASGLSARDVEFVEGAGTR